MRDLLLLHGALGAASQLDDLVPLLAPRFRVHVVEFEGHGATPARERPLRIEHFGENVTAALAAAGVSAPVVFGYSMGGYVALHLAAAHPGLLGPIVTLGTKLRWTPQAAMVEAKLLDAPAIAAKLPGFARQLAARHTAMGWEWVLDATRDLLLHLGEHPLLGAAELARVHVPVRIMLGDRDATVTAEECLEAYHALPAGELEVLPRTPHPLQRVDAARIERAVSEMGGL